MSTLRAWYCLVAHNVVQLTTVTHSFASTSTKVNNYEVFSLAKLQGESEHRKRVVLDIQQTRSGTFNAADLLGSKANMAKKIIGNLKLRIPGGRATAGPPVGSTLGQWGLNMMDFINPFNDATKEFNGKDVIVHLQVFEDRTFTWKCLGQPVDDMIRDKIGIKKGSGKPHTDKVGTITRAQLEEIAQAKMEQLNANDLDAAVKIVAGSARSMGVTVEG